MTKESLKEIGNKLVALIIKHGGWVENGMIKFPSVAQREQFEKEWMGS